VQRMLPPPTKNERHKSRSVLLKITDYSYKIFTYFVIRVISILPYPCFRGMIISDKIRSGIFISIDS